MVDIVISQPTSTSTPDAGPEVSQPYSIPAGMTPEGAKARLNELKQDKDFSARLFKGGNQSREGREWDALIRHAAGAQPPEAKVEPTPSEKALAALGAPAKPEDYKLNDVRDPATGWPIRMDEETSTLVNGTLLPAAHALDLSQADVVMIADGVTRPMDEEKCDATLHRIWGKDFEKGLEDFRAAVADPRLSQYKLPALFEAYPETLGNNPALIAGIVAAYRRRGLADKQSVARKRSVS
jgi:hypothetical protein